MGKIISINTIIPNEEVSYNFNQYELCIRDVNIFINVNIEDDEFLPSGGAKIILNRVNDEVKELYFKDFLNTTSIADMAGYVVLNQKRYYFANILRLLKNEAGFVRDFVVSLDEFRQTLIKKQNYHLIN